MIISWAFLIYHCICDRYVKNIVYQTLDIKVSQKSRHENQDYCYVGIRAPYFRHFHQIVASAQKLKKHKLRARKNRGFGVVEDPVPTFKGFLEKSLGFRHHKPIKYKPYTLWAV